MESIHWRSTELKAQVKKFEEAKYRAGHTAVTLKKGEWNTYWMRDGVKYLAPGAMAPTILRKVRYGTVRRIPFQFFAISN